MFGFGKKEIRCQGCSKLLEKKKYHVLDETHRGVYKNKRERALCPVCFIEKFRECLRAFDGVAIVVEPFKPPKSFLNAYQFYAFDNMVRYNYQKKDVDIIRRLAPQKGACSVCSSLGQYLLFSPELYSRDPHAFKIRTDIQGKLLCAECLAKAIGAALEREQIFYDEVWPPAGGDGFLTPMQC
jgi:hypothetical protein